MQHFLVVVELQQKRVHPREGLLHLRGNHAQVSTDPDLSITVIDDVANGPFGVMQRGECGHAEATHAKDLAGRNLDMIGESAVAGHHCLRGTCRVGEHAKRTRQGLGPGNVIPVPMCHRNGGEIGEFKRDLRQSVAQLFGAEATVHKKPDTPAFDDERITLGPAGQDTKPHGPPYPKR